MIPNLEGFSRYHVTEDGEVIELSSGRTLPQHTRDNGYLGISHLVADDGSFRQRTVHSLVADTYIPNPGNLPEVNHKDEDKTNNHRSNLERCTRQYNAEYSLAKEFKLISPQGNVVTVFNLAKFCRDNNLNKANLYKVCKGIRRSHKGWRTYETFN